MANGTNGLRKTDTNWFKIGLFVFGALSGSVGGVGGLQLLSPTNVKLQEEVHVLSNRYEDYVVSHGREVELTNELINSKLKNIQEDIKEIKQLIKNGR